MRRRISCLISFSFARMRSARVFRLIWNLPARVLPQMKVKPRKLKVSGLPSPRRLRRSAAKRPNSISRVFSANKDSRPQRYLIFRGSIPHPMQSLCTLRNPCCQWPRNTRYQAGATPYLSRASTGWIAPACGWRTYSITSSVAVSPSTCQQRDSIAAKLRCRSEDLCRDPAIALQEFHGVAVGILDENGANSEIKRFIGRGDVAPTRLIDGELIRATSSSRATSRVKCLAGLTFSRSGRDGIK
jgi:hypothetical protein